MFDIIHTMNEGHSHILKRIPYWGVTPQLTPVFAKRIILTNLLGLLFTINMSVSGFAFIYFGHYKLALFTFFFVLTEIAWPILNHFKHYNLSRLGMLISSNLLGLGVSIVLPGTGYNRGFFVMAGLPILLFSLKEKKSIFLGLLLPLLLYPLSEWAQYQVPFGLTHSPEMSFILRTSIGTIYVLLIFLMFLFLARENARAEEELEEQRARAFSSAKFAALGEMASGIAHEINNPMTVIGLTTEQLKFIVSTEDKPKEKSLERLNVISKTVQRVELIIDAMRSFSREAGMDPMSPEPLKKIIDDTLTFCAERFKNHKVILEVKLQDESIMLNCRGVQISQVLLNLLNNAFDAVEGLEERWIKLEAFRENERVIIHVTDSGKGIPEEEWEKIFQPFYTTKPVGKGTGLGLSLSRKIAQDHKGSLTLDTNSPNTRFVIELPV